LPSAHLCGELIVDQQAGARNRNTVAHCKHYYITLWLADR
jgi:hypothetical protein